MTPLHEGIVYGPLRSRRLGYSLGINILPRHRKVCTFNCGYCEYGWTPNYPSGATADTEAWPGVVPIARSVLIALDRLGRRGERIERLTLSGHGEPTLHPQFAEVVNALVRVRDERAKGVRLTVLTNGSTAGHAGVRAALERLDERHVKLDAGDATLMKRVNAATVPLEDIVRSLRQLSSIVVQSMFVRDGQGRIDNSGDLAVSAWIARVASLHPAAVHVYTIDRAPAWPYLQPVSAARLQEIVHRARAAGLAAEAFVPPAAAAAR